MLYYVIKVFTCSCDICFIVFVLFHLTVFFPLPCALAFFNIDLVFSTSCSLSSLSSEYKFCTVPILDCLRFLRLVPVGVHSLLVPE